MPGEGMKSLVARSSMYAERARRERVSKSVLLILAAVVVMSLAAIVPLSTPSRGATTHTVEMFNFYFSPQFLTVAPGDSVIWHNSGTLAHTSTSNTSAWPEQVVNPGSSSPAVLMPTTPGTYSYICSFHFGAYGMWGEIIVSTSVPEFSGAFVAVIGMLVIALGLILARPGRPSSC